jgi:hypothetical protein
MPPPQLYVTYNFGASDFAENQHHSGRKLSVSGQRQFCGYPTSRRNVIDVISLKKQTTQQLSLVKRQFYYENQRKTQRNTNDKSIV